MFGEAELKETRFEKLSLAEVCALDEGFEEAPGRGLDRTDVGRVGRNAVKAGKGTGYGFAFLGSSGLVDQSRVERSSIPECTVIVREKTYFRERNVSDRFLHVPCGIVAQSVQINSCESRSCIFSHIDKPHHTSQPLNSCLESKSEGKPL